MPNKSLQPTAQPLRGFAPASVNVPGDCVSAAIMRKQEVTMDDSRQSFLLSEYSALRQEILDTLKELPSNEKLGLVFSGAYWAWVLSNLGGTMYLSIAVWIPGVLSILFALRARSFGKKLGSFHNYLLKIEQEFDLGELGWEKHLETKKGGWFEGYNRAFWPALIFGNVVAGIVLLSIRQCA